MIRLLLIVIFLTGCQERIIHDLQEMEANKLITKLFQADIVSKKHQQADGLWSITVKEEDVIFAIQLIDETRIFKKQIKDPYKSAFLSSEQEQKLIYERTLAQELEATLQSLVGVLEAHVYLNINNKKDLWKKNDLKEQLSSAAVLLIVNQQFSLNQQEVNEIVAGAAGIEEEQINTVINYPQLVNFSKFNEEEFLIETIQKNTRNAKRFDFKSFFLSLPIKIGIVCLTFLLIIWTVLKVNNYLKIKKFKKDLAI